MLPQTLDTIARWCGGTVANGAGAVRVKGVCTDSRKIERGELFVPLAGERFDGHDYMDAAMARGAAAVLSARETSYPGVYVDDPLRALGAMATAWRAQLQAKVVAVTGSVGKTTTKEMLAAVLSAHCKTAKTQANFNNHIGLPLTVLGIEPDCRAAVLELGMNHFGEMSHLTAIAQPDVAVITNIGTMHIEFLGSREGILRAKMEILEGLRPGGTALFNGDEPLLWQQREKVRALYFGIDNPQCDLRAENVQLGEHVRFTACGMGHRFDVELPVEGRHMVYNALVAIAVALLWGVPEQTICRGLSAFSNTGMRQKIYRAAGFTIMEDCYNAGPESMRASLQVLAAKPGRKIAVLGEMLELGEHAAQAHYDVGYFAAACADVVLCFGVHAAQMAAGAAKGGAVETSVASSHAELAERLAALVRPCDVILFKGSRGTRMEQALQLFLQSFTSEESK